MKVNIKKKKQQKPSFQYLITYSVNTFHFTDVCSFYYQMGQLASRIHYLKTNKQKIKQNNNNNNKTRGILHSLCPVMRKALNGRVKLTPGTDQSLLECCLQYKVEQTKHTSLKTVSKLNVCLKFRFSLARNLTLALNHRTINPRTWPYQPRNDFKIGKIFYLGFFNQT